MNRFPWCVSSLLVALLLTCCTAPGAVAAKKIPKSRFANGVYKSPDGDYTIRVPALIEPGAWNEERRSEERRGAFFGDDFGTSFYVLVTDNRKNRVTLDSIATEFTVGGDLHEKEFVETPRGRELRMAGIRRGGSSLVSRTKQDGKTVEQSLDLAEAWSLFLHGENIYLVSSGVTLLKDTHRSDGEVVAQAKQQLKEALESLVLDPKPPGK